MSDNDRNEKPWILRRALVGLLLISGLAWSLRKEPAEIHVFTQAAQRLAEGTDLYQVNDAKPFTSPPFFALLFLPLSGLGDGWTKGLFFALNASLLVLAIRWLDASVRCAFDWSESPSRSILWFGALLLAGRPLLSVFQNQSHDLFLFAAIAFAINRSTCRPGPANRFGTGFGFAFAAACKATPLAFLPMLLWSGRFVASIVFVLTAAGLTLLPDLTHPRADDRLHVEMWIDNVVEAASPTNRAVNQNLSDTLLRLSREAPEDPRQGSRHDIALWNPEAATLQTLTRWAQLLVIVSIAWITRPRTPRKLENEDAHEFAFRALGRASAICCGMLLLSPISMKTHFGLLIVPALFVLATWIHRGASRGVVAATVSVFVLGTLTSKGLLGREIGSALLAYGTLCWATVAMLFAVGRSLGRAKDPIEITTSVVEQ